MDLTFSPDGTVELSVPDWPGFAMRGLAAGATIDGTDLYAANCRAGEMPDGANGHLLALGEAELLYSVRTAGGEALEVRCWLRNRRDEPLTLNRVMLIEAAAERSKARFGDDPAEVVTYRNQFMRSAVRPLRDSASKATTAGNEPNDAALAAATEDRLPSQYLGLIYDRRARRSLLGGMLTAERFQGRIELDADADGSVRLWRLGFDGGDLLVEPGECTELESFTLLVGGDPWALLEQYGDRTAGDTSALPSAPPVSWCSWYPYRLGVSEQRLLETARIAERRLKPLGLTIIETDLGWEDRCLPSAFEENERFPSGLKALSEKLEEMGFVLGAWKAPFAVSEFDPIVREHPEWLIRDADGKPRKLWTWFWEPHGDIYAFDLTRPEVLEHLRAKFRTLHERGVKYYKSDFSSYAFHPRSKDRFDPRLVAGGGEQTARRAWEMIREELPDALLLNCGGPDLPGTGRWDLLYVCNDTGNTGVIAWGFHARNYLDLAGHLWKNGRWGVIQPSCLCVGLPGTLEEARVRATAAFMAGGQIDISDTLQTLPEDRWAVLEASLPPLGVAAKPVDLFEPVYDPGTPEYVAQCRGEESEIVARPHPPGSVWHLRVEREWDRWDLAALFVLDNGHGNDMPQPARFAVPLERLGLDSSGAYWASEFWSGQFLGVLRGRRNNAGGYEHIGDLQDLFSGTDGGTLDVSFSGPAAKLICLREAREHPWVACTSFHQSCGAELEAVAWDERNGELSGRLIRPAGHSGALIFAAGDGWEPLSAEIDGRNAPLLPAANGAWKLPIATAADATGWRVLWRRA